MLYCGASGMHDERCMHPCLRTGSSSGSSSWTFQRSPSQPLSPAKLTAPPSTGFKTRLWLLLPTSGWAWRARGPRARPTGRNDDGKLAQYAFTLQACLCAYLSLYIYTYIYIYIHLSTYTIYPSDINCLIMYIYLLTTPPYCTVTVVRH